MTNGDAQHQLRELIRARLGAIMHNPIREPGTTCRVCFAPLSRPGYTTCWECNQHRLQAQTAGSLTLADHTVALTYAIEGQQSNLDMHRYKDPMTDAQRVTSNAWQRVSLLVVGFGLWHARCIDRASRKPVTRLATVPSLRGRPDRHPLDDLTAYLPHAWQRTSLLPASAVPETHRRSVNPGHFIVPDPTHVIGQHVGVLEDTWVRGGHAQSAAAAIQAAGASEVTIITVARRLAAGYGPNQAFLNERLSSREYEAGICPITGDTCPT